MRRRQAAGRNRGLPEDQARNGPRQPVRPPFEPYPRPYAPRAQHALEENFDDDVFQEPTMGELSAPNFRNQTWCIHESPELEDILVSTGVVHNLPKFSGTQGESATSHLKRFHGTCQNLKPHGVDVEDLKLKAFYFSLMDAANDWFLALPSGSIRTLAQMQANFLAKYYPAGRATQVRRQLQEFKQGPNESMYDYLEKFNRLEGSCCNLGLHENLLLEYLMDGFKPLDKMLLNASDGGSMLSLTLREIRDLISKVAENARFQEETSRQEEFMRTRNVAKAETPSSHLTEDVKQMKEMMIHLMRREPAKVRPCEFCGAMDHKTDSCPTLLEDDHEEVNAVGDYQGYQIRVGPSRPYGQGPSGKTWRNDAPRDLAHHAQQAAPQANQQFYRPPQRQYQQNRPGPYQKGPSHNQSGPGPVGPSRSLEDMMKELATSNVQMNATIQQNQVETKGAIAEINKQLSQLATTVSELKKETGRLPSQPIQNPRGIVSSVTLRSGKQLAVESEEQREEEGSMMPEENQTEPGALVIDEPEHVRLSDKNREHPGRALSADGPEPGRAMAPEEYASQ
ncbi:unnamed protein product [Rhodiola kirilowii]